VHVKRSLAYWDGLIAAAGAPADAAHLLARAETVQLEHVTASPRGRTAREIAEAIGRGLTYRSSANRRRQQPIISMIASSCIDGRLQRADQDGWDGDRFSLGSCRPELGHYFDTLHALLCMVRARVIVNSYSKLIRSRNAT